MPGRLLPLAATLALAVAVGGAGCADDVSPAVRIGETTISHDDLMAEVEDWASSPTLLTELQIGSTGAAGGNGFSTEFVDFVLTNRIAFELHNAEFDARGLELSPEELEQVRTGLFADPAITATVLDELGEEYAERLVTDVARQFEIQTVLAEDYSTWTQEAFTREDIEVSPRYGTWDRASGAVLAPEGPRPAPGSAPVFEL